MRPIHRVMSQSHRVAFALLLAVSASGTATAAEPDGPETLITRTESIRMAIQKRLSATFTQTTAARKSERGALVEFYAAPGQRLLWIDDRGLTERGKAVMAEIAKADDYGLRAADYRLPKPDTFDAASADAAEWLAEAETKISYAVLRYARDARGGRIDPSRLSRNLDPTLALPKPLEVIESIAIRSDPAAYVRSFQPDQPQFEALRQKLLELRGGKTETVKPAVQIPDGPLLRLGIVHEQVALLRKRLEVSSANPDRVMQMIFDEQVAEAVRRFQRAHGAVPDGVVGAGTRRLLNGGSQSRATGNPAQIRAILINMERWRWLPHDLGAFYVTVNVPEFMLRVVSDDGPVYTTRVIVGKPNTQTPIFSDEMQTVVFGPYWNVPTSIKVAEIRPYLRQESGGWLFRGGGWNTSVLRRHGLRVRYGARELDPASIDWNRVDIRTLQLYQPPGPRNVLGKVKFMFPNKHDVYMHDTPQKHLFAQPVRAESHGCMRVQNPERLAAIIMKRDKGWNEGRTYSALETGYDHQVPLHRKIPVYVTYFTLTVNADGSISTYRDIYGHDARMAGALRL